MKLFERWEKNNRQIQKNGEKETSFEVVGEISKTDALQ